MFSISISSQTLIIQSMRCVIEVIESTTFKVSRITGRQQKYAEWATNTFLYLIFIDVGTSVLFIRIIDCQYLPIIGIKVDE